MEEIAELLQAAKAGAADAVAELVRLNYQELRRLAHARISRSGDVTSLQTTALVHEAYLRLVQASPIAIPDRARFFAYAARAMRSVIIDVVRERAAERHGGGMIRVTLDTGIAEEVMAEAEVLRVHEALEELRSLDARLAEVVEMRYFAGMSEPEIASVLDVSERTVRRHWEKARRVLATLIAPG